MTLVRQPIHSRRTTIMAGRYRKRDGMGQGNIERIDDVIPAVRERVSGLERDVESINREFRDHREESIRQGAHFATKEGVDNLKQEVTTELNAINRRLDKRVAYIVTQSAALVITMAYGLILSYKHFIQP